MTDIRPPGWDRQVETREDRYDWERARGLISAFGESKLLGAWAKDERCTITREALRNRLAMGWDPERAISAPKSERLLLSFTHGGRTLTLRGWADWTGIRYGTLYRRVNAGMSFDEAVDAGPQEKAPVVPVTAFGETKALSRWAVDERAAVGAGAIANRLANGWEPERAITEPPWTQSGTTGTGTSYTAWGRTMPVGDWARISGHPTEQLYGRLARKLTMETALQSLGWLPPWEADPHQILRIPPDQLRAGDLVVSTGPTTVTVRRLPDPAEHAPASNAAAVAARSRNALPGAAAHAPATRASTTLQTPAAPRSARPRPGPPPSRRR